MSGEGSAAARIKARLRQGADLLAAAAVLAEDAATMAAEWTAALRAGGRLLFFGNGGSHADAQHLTGELVNRYLRDRRALPALALGANVPVLTAVANDSAYREVFAREVEAYGRPGDVAVGLSTSGSSQNVVAGLEAARRLGLRTHAFTGAGGGAVAAAADRVVRVPSRSTPLIQQVHLAIGHVLCELVEEALGRAP